MSKKQDITNQKFGKLTAIKYSYTTDGKNRRAVWECRCDCGNICYVQEKRLKSGNTKSCGCLKIERVRMLKYKDNRMKDRLYNVWTSMLRRCYDSKDNVYKYYGARDITVCKDWHDYAKFKAWAYQSGYDDTLPRGQCTIDRIDSSQNYDPENCRWATLKEQQNNKRTNRFIKYNGETHTMSEWAGIIGIKPDSLKNRIYRGWSIEKALTEPLRVWA